MNIFILDPNPQIAAQYHCDQHLHKMILESAQMLSTAVHAQDMYEIRSHVYRPAYQKHPCTIWTSDSPANMVYLCTLATELSNIRESVANTSEHSSMGVIKTIRDYLAACYPHTHWQDHTPFAEAMYAHIKLRTDLTTVQKYQEYYKKKHAQWVLDKGAGMSYKGRLIPPFMQGVL